MRNSKTDPPAREGGANWDVAQQNLLAATLAATPTQRLDWLEEVLHLAYASGALKPRESIRKWDTAS
jgi:hypothetical protein